ncbi:hypothetical protein [Corynebacterium ciconiae]|uniref:hypothetical protein n=1 Tax=Corynebacterium ciconiae TaxID=227319 RepID=UPI0003706D81|nr:hypothetical protein [Corynebacterium ciconiae]
MTLGASTGSGERAEELDGLEVRGEELDGAELLGRELALLGASRVAVGSVLLLGAVELGLGSVSEEPTCTLLGVELVGAVSFGASGALVGTGSLLLGELGLSGLEVPSCGRVGVLLIGELTGVLSSLVTLGACGELGAEGCCWVLLGPGSPVLGRRMILVGGTVEVRELLGACGAVPEPGCNGVTREVLP